MSRVVRTAPARPSERLPSTSLVVCLVCLGCGPKLEPEGKKDAIKDSKSSVAWVTAWPSPAVHMAPDNFRVMAAWFVGEGPHLLRPLLGLSLRSKEWGAVDEHGVAVCAALGWCRRASGRKPLPQKKQKKHLFIPWCYYSAFRCQAVKPMKIWRRYEGGSHS
jgi:hypothetical protein